MNWAVIVVILSALFYSLHQSNVYYPERFHGHGRDNNFFEGWYFKVVDPTEKHSLVVIIGIFFGNTSDAKENHAFVMTIVNGSRISKFDFNVSQFVAHSDKFHVTLGENVFSEAGISLNLKPKSGDDARETIVGNLSFRGNVGWPVTWTSPGVMGWYAFIPTLECYHGVLSMNHNVSGHVTVNGTEILYSGGTGYTEKDWGFNFPKTWIWLQSNNFHNSGNSISDTSIFVSVASVPWKGYSFPGFLVGFYHEGILHQFTEWSGAKFKLVSSEKNAYKMKITDNEKFLLEVTLIDSPLKVKLYGPKDGIMVPFVDEGVSCDVEVKFSEISSGVPKLLFEGVGKHTACEIVGNIEWLKQNL